jgi:uncharacterized protein YbaR (Trm112 family)
MALDEKLLAILACPQDHGPLYLIADEELLFNPRLRRAYRIVDDIPIMLIDEAISLDEADAERLAARVAAESIPPTFSD